MLSSDPSGTRETQNSDPSVTRETQSRDSSRTRETQNSNPRDRRRNTHPLKRTKTIKKKKKYKT